jgi:excisionase family DNA binding protein
VATAARAASVSPATIRKWISEGRLPRHAAGRVWRVRRSDLEKLLGTPTEIARPTETPEVLALRDHVARKLRG